MSADTFYRPVEPDILQGDIFKDVPHLFLKPPLKAIRGPKEVRGRKIWGVYNFPFAGVSESVSSEQPSIGGPFDFATGEQVPVTCNVTRAILLNHECDIENEHEHRLVALVRPLAPVANPEHRQWIKENRNSAFYYLPPQEERGLEEGYVDFRRITALAPGFLVPSNRLAALTQEAVKALQAQLFRHFTHRVLTTPEPSLSSWILQLIKSLWKKLLPGT